MYVYIIFEQRVKLINSCPIARSLLMNKPYRRTAISSYK